MGMTINRKSIQNKIAPYMNSPLGRKRIESATTDTMKQLATELIDCIERHLPESIKGTVQDSIISEPEMKNDGSFVISITVPTNAVWRDSLTKNGGVDNIVVLLNNGYHASSYAYGQWHGENIRSLKDRAGGHFMQKAINEFNIKYGSKFNCSAELEEKYM